MSLPNACVEPFDTRFGEMPPLNRKSVELAVVPCWKIVSAAGSISYHRTAEPAPPAIVCCVHNATRPPVPRAGSIADTACVLRPSSVLITELVCDCGALGGIEKVGTLRSVPVVWKFGVPFAFFVTLNSESVEDGFLPSTATTQPVLEPSVWLAGTGVNAWVPSLLWIPAARAAMNVLASGQVDPDAGLLIPTRSEPTYVPAELENVLVPINRKFEVSPSFG